MNDVKYIGKAHKASPPGGKLSLWELNVYRVSDGKLVASSNVSLTNNEHTTDIAVAKAQRKAKNYRP